MSGWVKTFSDHTFEIGSATQTPPWNSGRLTGIIGAGAQHNLRHIAISSHVEADYWYSETVVNGHVTKRRVSRLLRDGERLLGFLVTPNSTMIKVFDLYTDGPTANLCDTLEAVHVSYVGQWLVLEYDVLTNTVHHYYSTSRG